MTEIPPARRNGRDPEGEGEACAPPLGGGSTVSSVAGFLWAAPSRSIWMRSSLPTVPLGGETRNPGGETRAAPRSRWARGTGQNVSGSNAVQGEPGGSVSVCGFQPETGSTRIQAVPEV